MENKILILDFGSQFTQLIARRLREFHVYCEIHPFNYPLEKIKQFNPKGIILSGGPFSVYDKGAPLREVKPLSQIAPLLGVCYGMQLIIKEFGGLVESSGKREYGESVIQWEAPLVEHISKTQTVWMSHGDVVKAPPEGFEILAHSENNHPAVMKSKNVWCYQFHPEVSHTENGGDLIKAFAFGLCGVKPSWSMKSIKDELIAEIQNSVAEGESVLCALSGGVDSTVVGTLLTQALGHERVHCVFVDNGLLRKDEFERVIKLYSQLGLNVDGVDARQKFMTELKGLTDPEQKRKTIGRVFIEVFKESIDKITTTGGEKIKWLAQGTLYPDRIESVSVYGKSSTIKSHHNVGGLPKDLNLSLVEPLKNLFKDEVRELGKALGIPHNALWRHPFPGPGLAIRCIGEVNEEDLNTLREVDSVFINELVKHNLYDSIWQAFCVLLPVQTVGVQGDQRTYDKVVALRAVTSKDGMTADWFDFPYEFLKSVSNKITNEVRGVNRVVYDITSKPPGTIEWE